MRTLVMLATLLVVALAAPALAFACKCQPLDRSQSYEASDIVFYGEAVQGDEGEVAFKVLRSWRGTRRKRTLRIVTESPCDALNFEPEKKYMVFASDAGKRAIRVHACSATRELEHRPMSPVVWTIADQVPYRASRKLISRHQRYRDRLNSRALDKLRYAVRKCDAKTWKGRDEASAKIEVRFDVLPDGVYETHLVSYTSPSEDLDAVRTCLIEKLEGKKFSRFRGGPVSVEAYLILDRIDATMKRDKKSSVVVAYGGRDREGASQNPGAD